MQQGHAASDTNPEASSRVVLATGESCFPGIAIPGPHHTVHARYGTFVDGTLTFEFSTLRLQPGESITFAALEGEVAEEVVIRSPSVDLDGSLHSGISLSDGTGFAPMRLVSDGSIRLGEDARLDTLAPMTLEAQGPISAFNASLTRTSPLSFIAPLCQVSGSEIRIETEDRGPALSFDCADIVLDDFSSRGAPTLQVTTSAPQGFDGEAVGIRATQQVVVGATKLRVDGAHGGIVIEADELSMAAPMLIITEGSASEASGDVRFDVETEIVVSSQPAAAHDATISVENPNGGAAGAIVIDAPLVVVKSPLELRPPGVLEGFDEACLTSTTPDDCLPLGSLPEEPSEEPNDEPSDIADVDWTGGEPLDFGQDADDESPVDDGDSADPAAPAEPKPDEPPGAGTGCSVSRGRRASPRDSGAVALLAALAWGARGCRRLRRKRA